MNFIKKNTKIYPTTHTLVYWPIINHNNKFFIYSKLKPFTQTMYTNHTIHEIQRKGLQTTYPISIPSCIEFKKWQNTFNNIKDSKGIAVTFEKDKCILIHPDITYNFVNYSSHPNSIKDIYFLIESEIKNIKNVCSLDYTEEWYNDQLYTFYSNIKQ